MHETLVIDVVGLTPKLLPYAPTLSRLAGAFGERPLRTVTPALTCSAQSTFVTGLLPRDHGIVGNGWYFRDLAQIWFWRQSNHLVGGEKVWDAAKRRDPSFTCAKLFWWYNMYSTADYSLTPRPMYPSDGRKLPDVYSHPPELRHDLQRELGTFPLFNFWGPRSSIASSAWIAESAIRVIERHSPTLSLVYLPHLDYDLQKYGPDDPRIVASVGEVDSVCAKLLALAERRGARVIVLSEYGIVKVDSSLFPNRTLRRAGLLRVRDELGLEQLDAGASEAFAVVDHQIAHVYVKCPERIAEVKALFEGLDGIEQVLDRDAQREYGIDHERSGELVLLAESDRWFSYYFWLDDALAPDYARTVDIHQKPGYDPVELFVDPRIVLPTLKVASKLLRRKLGFRTLLDVIPLDASLVKGSHGRVTDDADAGPVFISSCPKLVDEGPVAATDVKALILRHVFDD